MKTKTDMFKFSLGRRKFTTRTLCIFVIVHVNNIDFDINLVQQLNFFIIKCHREILEDSI